MNNQRRHGGYTLLEVVVAFAILVLSLSALFESFSMTLGRSEKSRNLSRAALLAQSVRDRVGIDLPLSAPLSDGADEDCSWTVHSKPLPRSSTGHDHAILAMSIAIDARCGDRGTFGAAHLDTVELAQQP